MAKDDRRRAPRVPYKVPIKLRPSEGNTPYTWTAESRDFSDSGVFLTLENPPAVGTSVDLSFTMPGEVTGGLPMKVRCSARVVRLEREGLPDGKTGIAAHIERFETIVGEI